MAKAKPKKSKRALGRAASLLASIPAVGNVRNAAKKVGKATKTIKKTVKKATKTSKKVVKSAKKKVKKTVKKKKKKAKKKAKKKRKKLRKKVGKVFTKARKLKNNLSPKKRVQKLKKKMKKTVLKAKKGIKKVGKTVKKTSKAVIKNSKKIMKKTVLVAKSFTGGGFNGREVISTAADMIPVVGNVKSLYEGVVGKDPITGRKLSKTERAMAGVSTFLGGGTKVLTRGGSKVVSSLISGGKKPAGKLTVPKGTEKVDDFAKEPFLPDEAYGKNLPKFVEPGKKSLNKYDEFGKLKQTKYYDDYGREKGWVDFTNHGYPENHSVPHWHEVQWNERYPIGGYKIDHRMDTNIPFK